MSVKVSHEVLPSVKFGGHAAQDPYGLPISSPAMKDGSHPLPKQRVRPMCDGVRVPILKDIDRHGGKGGPATCRFDIVEKVTTVIKAGAYGPSDVNTTGVESRSSRVTHDNGHHHMTVNLSRQPTFQSTVSRSSEQDVWAKISPYKWNQWVKTAREGDARDVLYKNTYCLEKDHLRYRTLTLPRLGSDRPRTVGDKPKECYRTTSPDHTENSTGVTIVPQQPRGTVVRFREYMRPYTYASDGTALEVKRVNSRAQNAHHFTTVKSVFPLIRHDSRQCSRKSERPLKFENSKYNRSNKDTLFNRQILPIYKSAFERDYSSADTFKEYLDSLQQCATANTPFMYSRESQRPVNSNSQDYHNQVLQQVKNVNEPKEPTGTTPRVPATPRPQDNRSITVEIKSSWKEAEENDSNSADTSPRKEVHKTATIENLSSVHGSVVQPRDPGPTSSTVVNGGGAGERPVVPAAPVPEQSSPRGSTCPTNTPIPLDV